MLTRLRLSCRALLIIVLVRPNFYSALYYMRDSYTDNNLIDYYTIIFNFVAYCILAFTVSHLMTHN